jgi:hypothetical protein
VCLLCKFKFDIIGLGGNFLLMAKTPSFLLQPNKSTSQKVNSKNKKIKKLNCEND